MEVVSNLECAEWAEANVLGLKGWATGRDGSALRGVRVRSGKLNVAGYHGIRRVDVAENLGHDAANAYSGFSIVAEVQPQDFPLAIEFEFPSGEWRQVLEVARERVAARSTNVRDDTLVPWNNGASPRKGPKRILFISHDMAAAGAQMLLLRFVTWLKKKGSWEIETLIAVPREYAAKALSAEQAILRGFEAVGPVHFISDYTQAPENLPAIRHGRYQVVYANTSDLGWLLPALEPIPCPVISHVHELGFWMTHRSGLENVARQAQSTDHFIACGTAVGENLARVAHISPKQIEVIHACGSIARATAAAHETSREHARKELGIPADAFVVVACGTFDWRKGAALFAPICVNLQQRLGARALHAFWIGSYHPELVREQFDHEVAMAGLAGRVRLLGHQSAPLKWMIAADCFALPSLEDPFPMVMLEAGTLGLPIVAFEHSGGAAEFIAGQAGTVVPYLDVAAFAAALAELAHHPRVAARKGAVARDRAATLFDEERSFSLIQARIDRIAVHKH
jgi:glycosyltransferase involved in cell wall biosynthesis